MAASPILLATKSRAIRIAVSTAFNARPLKPDWFTRLVRLVKSPNNKVLNPLLHRQDTIGHTVAPAASLKKSTSAISVMPRQHPQRRNENPLRLLDAHRPAAPPLISPLIEAIACLGGNLHGHRERFVPLDPPSSRPRLL